jgi:hypothetical protein
MRSELPPAKLNIRRRWRYPHDVVRSWPSLLFVMRFDSQYPAAPVGFRTPNGFCHADSHEPCSTCNSQTDWFSLGLLLFFCSDECYWRFLRDSHNRDSENY